MRTIGIVSIILVLTSGAATAGTTVCDALIHTSIPYEIHMKDETGKITALQVYRGEHLYKTIIEKTNNGVRKTIGQSNFVKNIVDDKGNETIFDYDVPTTAYFYDQGITSARLKATSHTATNEEILGYAVQGEENLSLGPCSFKVKRYINTARSENIDSKNEIWFAPELNMILKFHHTGSFLKTHRSFDKRVEAIDISTDVIPFH